MYAGTKVNWHEVLMPDSVPELVNESLPLFLCAFSADKGSEEITDLVYRDFTAMYGTTADFFKYGQPLVQAHKILAAGGRVLGKRIVAPDAALANLIIAAEVSSVEENKTNAAGQQLYIDADGNETTEVTDTPAVTNKAKIKYKAATCPAVKNLSEVVEYANTLETESLFPLFVICDNGRGVSVKSVRIDADYDVSKTLDYMLYRIQDVENTNVIETQRFSVYPDAINNINGSRRNMSLANLALTQFKTDYSVSGLNHFVAKLSEITGYTKEELYGMDIIFGKTNKGKALDSFIIDLESEGAIDLTATYGIGLESGTNGVFGDAPFVGGEASETWTAEAVKFFNGTVTDEIYDLDQHKIDYCVDANYPMEVKHAIAALADFREDFYFFRDLGLGVKNFSDVETIIAPETWEKSPFVGDYLSTYDVIDTFSRKQIKVTMMHGFAPLLVNHYSTNVSAPLAGEFNNFVITEAIPGTLNFVPRITPLVNQKEQLEELKVNYVNYSSDGLLTVQSTYTSQDHYGPLTYASNVIVTQMCIKDIRRYCPKIRFMLMGENDVDFSEYRQLIDDNVISKYAQHFKSIELIYTRDDLMTASKIFNASLYCYYRDFAQGEIFDVFSVEGSPETNPAY